MQGGNLKYEGTPANVETQTTKLLMASELKDGDGGGEYVEELVL